MRATLGALTILLLPLAAHAQQGTVQIRAAAIPSAAVGFLQQGDNRLREGEIEEAVKNYAHAVIAAPKFLAARWCLGVTLLATRRTELAVKEFQEATRLAEDDLITALLLQGALQEYGNPGASQQIYLDTVRRFSRPGKPGLDASGSIARLESYAKQYPKSPVLALLLGDANQVSGQYEAAGRSYRIAIALAPKWSKPQVNLARSLLAQGKPNLAVAALQGVLKQDPNNPRLLLAMGDAQFQAGNSQDALKIYSRLSSVEAVSVSAATGAARANVAMGQIPSAISSLQNARKRAPKDPAPVAALADLQMRTGDFTAAVESYSSALKLTEEGGLFAARPSLQRALAESQLSAKRAPEALKTLSRALQDDPENESLWRRLMAKAYLEQNDRPAAEQELKRALTAETTLYPLETLNAIAQEGWTEKFIAGFRSDLQGARTGVRGSVAGPGNIEIRSTPVSREAEAYALASLAHLLRFTNAVREEVSLRRDLVRIRGNGTDWFLLAQAQEILGENVDAATSYGEAMRKGDLTSAYQNLAFQRIRALAQKPKRSPQP